MAEGGKDHSSADNSWESWLGGWVQSAKDKSSVAMEMVKKDLTEFSTIMQKETEKVVEKTSSQLKDSLNRENTAQATGKMKAGLTSFLDSVSKVLVIPPDDDDSVPMKVSSDGSGLYDKGKARLHALQLDVDTYTQPPRGAPEQFTMWQESFDLDQHKGDISDLLVSKVEVRALYTKLVPSEVSHAEFWQRYFYRVHQLDLDEARKKALMQRADQTRGDSLGWDDDDDDDWSDGEEDDGNQSDWEKLPKPNQAKKTSSPTNPLPKDKHSETANISQKSEHTNKTKSTDNKNSTHEEDCDKKEKVSISKPESVKDSPTVQVSPSDNDSKSPPQNLPNDNVSDVSDLAGSQMPSSNLWSLHIPDDTASAAQDEVVAHTDTTDSAPDSTGSAPDTTGPAPTTADHTSVVQDSSTCAAAAGDDSSSKLNVNTADGACGAVESPSSISDTIELPAASAPSGKSEVSGEETSDAGSVNAEASGDNVELKKKEAEPEATNTQLSDKDAAEKIAMKVKGDMVVVGDRETPSSTSEESNEAKDMGLEDDWDEDFDVELTEEDLKAAEDIAKRLGEGTAEGEDDWENWE